MNSDVSPVTSGTSGKHPQDNARSLSANNRCETLTECTVTNGDSHKSEITGSVHTEKNGSNTVLHQEEIISENDILMKNSSKSIISSGSQPTILFDRKNVEDETKNGFLGFSSESYLLNADVDAKNSFGNDSSDSDRNDHSVNEEQSNSTIENVFNDILKCSPIVRTERKEYSTDAVNLDELNLSVSKILNSTKNDKGGMKVENEKIRNDVGLKATLTKGDHTYHLPLPVFGSSNATKISEHERASNSVDEGNCPEKTCFTDLKCSSTNSNDSLCSSAISKNLSDGNGNQNPDVHFINTDDISIQSVNDEERSETQYVTSIDKKAVVKDSGNMRIPSIQNDKSSSNEVNVKISKDEKNQITTVDDKGSHVSPVKINVSVLKREDSSMLTQNETQVTLTEKKTIENSDFRSEIAPKEKEAFLETESIVESSNVSKEADKTEKNVLEVTQSTDFKISHDVKSNEDRSKNPLNKASTCEKLETRALSLEHSSVIAETSYDCNECGAKLKTQNSLFIHKKMHLSGAIGTSTAIKRKASEENEVPKEVKRKRGRPKLNKTEKTEGSNEEVTPLKENVVKKVMKKDVQSDEVKQPKSKKNAKEVKENKILNDTKVTKRERNPRLREPVPMKIISNKPKNTLRSENLDSDCKNAAKVESGKPKGKTKNYYSSAVSNNLLRKFTCSECGAKFKRNDHLKRHRLLHSEKTFQCHDCEMKFYRGDKLKLHIFRHHTKVPPKLTQKIVPVVKMTKLPKKSVECQKCGIQFLRIVPPKTDKSGQSRRKNSCCISCGAKMNDENN